MNGVGFSFQALTQLRMSFLECLELSNDRSV